MNRMRKLAYSLLVLSTAAFAVAYVANPVALVDAAGPRAAAASITVVATGLNNPRGLNFAPNGSLYVAEAGTGGPGPCVGGEQGENCFGFSGSITRIDLRHMTQERVVTGLPSVAPPSGNGALGPHDVVFRGLGKGYVTIGLGTDPNNRGLFGPGGELLASLVRFNPGGKVEYVADLGAYEANVDPAHDGPDSNPFGLLAQGSKLVYTDAGGNALNQVDAHGLISTLAVFPNRDVTVPPLPTISMDAVPTTVVVGPDGSYYVGQLTGFPFPDGGANVYRVPAGGGTPEIFASGFSAIIDIAFGPHGSLYVLEIARNGIPQGFAGALFRVDPDGTRTEIAPGALTAPGGIAIGKDGALYVTNNAISAGGGEVLRITE